MAAFDIPDFTSLANQQAGLNQTAANAATTANRANQTGPMGSLTWTQDPTTGQWTQNNNLNQPQQGVNTALAQNQTQQLGQSSSDLSNLGSWGTTPITQGVSAMPDGSFSANQQVIDAWNALQKPQLDQQADAERSRLAAMGVTMGSDASNNSERNIGNWYSDADNKGILAGTQAATQQFQNQMAQRQEGVNENVQQNNMINALRGQQVSEAKSLGSQTAYNPTYSSYAAATTAPAPNIYGAATDSWNAAQQQYGNAVGQQNQVLAQQANTTAGNYGLLGAGISLLGNKGVQSGLGSAWSGLSNLWGSAGAGGAGGAVNTGMSASDADQMW